MDLSTTDSRMRHKMAGPPSAGTWNPKGTWYLSDPCFLWTNLFVDSTLSICSVFTIWFGKWSGVPSAVQRASDRAEPESSDNQSPICQPLTFQQTEVLRVQTIKKSAEQNHAQIPTQKLVHKFTARHRAQGFKERAFSAKSEIMQTPNCWNPASFTFHRQRECRVHWGDTVRRPEWS